MLTIDQDHDILGIIDVQPTFMPGGELPVAEGDAVVPVINALLARTFDHAFATQDWHPMAHCSFASRHGRAPMEMVDMPYGPQMLFPDHGLAGTKNAELHPALDQTKIEAVIRKGFRRDIDSFSAFRENDRRTTTGLDGLLRERGIRRIFLCGLATDFCVFWSAEDAVALGFEVVMIEDACRGVAMLLPEGGDTVEAAYQTLRGRGVTVLRSDAISR